MKVSIDEIRIKEGRRSLDADHVKELADSIRELGLLNPITIDSENTLIAGLHRLEAARRLGWKEVECTVSSLDGLQAELAEIDENIIRSGLSPVEYGEILLRRKEIYEALHPETKNSGDRRSGKIRSAKCTSDSESSRSFVDDTAEKTWGKSLHSQETDPDGKEPDTGGKENNKGIRNKTLQKGSIKAFTPGTGTAEGGCSTSGSKRDTEHRRIYVKGRNNSRYAAYEYAV